MKVELTYWDVKRRNSKLANLQKELQEDKTLRRDIHKMLARVVDPYVPEDTGTLKASAKVTYHSVRWGNSEVYPYMHYVWEGEVYGPNFPIKVDGEIVGWRSPPGKGSKHPTGRRMRYSSSTATSHWAEVALREQRGVILKESGALIKQRARELSIYGKYYVR